MSRFEQDPTAWANKRKAAMERAKLIREQRKVGNMVGLKFEPNYQLGEGHGVPFGHCQQTGNMGIGH